MQSLHCSRLWVVDARGESCEREVSEVTIVSVIIQVLELFFCFNSIYNLYSLVSCINCKVLKSALSLLLLLKLIKDRAYFVAKKEQTSIRIKENEEGEDDNIQRCSPKTFTTYTLSLVKL
jgi:hypothetical protein